MIKPEQSSHWYTVEGEPAYGADLRKARKLGLVPSVTSIIGQLEKPAVTAWSNNLMSEVCHQYPAAQDETLPEYRKRIEAVYADRRSMAANIGTAIHNYAESYLNLERAEPVQGYARQCELLKYWIDDNLMDGEVEWPFSVVLPGGYGYGGKVDYAGSTLDGETVIVDFKTQDLKGKDSPTYYPEWGYQLAAYRHGLGMPGAKCLSVVIDTGDIQCIHTKEWTEDELSNSMDIFTNLVQLFYLRKKLAIVGC